MKATLEGTALEFRQFFRTGAPEDFEYQQCMFCGCTDEDACPGGCSWVAPGVCSRCAGIIHEALQQDVLKVREAAINVSKRIKNTSKDTERTKNTPKIPERVNIEDLLIPEFDHDRELKSSYKTLFFTEMEDGMAVLSYCGTKLYVKRERVLELPNPVPPGYFGKLKSGTPSNRATAIRFYRAYLGGQQKPGSEKKPEGEKSEEKLPEIEKKPVESKQTLLSGPNGAVVLAPFAEAERFDYTKLPNRALGSILYYENSDGRIAIKYYGHGDIVFITREQAAVLMKMDKDALAEYIGCINAAKQFILKKYIEALKDDEIGALGKIKTDTKMPQD